MLHVVLLSPIALLALLAGGKADSPSPPPGAIETHNPEGIIVPAEQGYRYFDRRTEYFTPTLEQVRQLENQLIRFLEKADLGYEHTSHRVELLRSLPSRRRQYIGLMLPNARWIKMLWGHPYPPGSVRGGGYGYGQVEYNPDTKAFRNLSINSGK